MITKLILEREFIIQYVTSPYSRLKTLLAFFIICLLASCNSSPELKKITFSKSPSLLNKSVNTKNSTAVYDYTSPDNTHILASFLDEISGLSYDQEKNVFITHDDENGAYYLLHKESFRIEKKIDFGKKDDYESIEKVKSDIVICRNDGTLFFHHEKSSNTSTYTTPLSKKNNVEGLCYQQDKNILLLACKGNSLADESQNIKSIYAFDLEEKSLNPKPYITIKNEDLKKYVLETNEDVSKSQRKKLIKRIKEFAPSGIAIQPDSKEFYILSGRGSTLVILDKNKILKRIVYLDKAIIPQPEGITFDDKGHLYIATEGQGFNAKIFQFKKADK